MLLLTFGILFALLSFGCSLFILFHAFQRSVGTGVMVLCIPCFMTYYAFKHFEHRRKGLIVSGWLACLVLAGVLYTFAAQGVHSDLPRGFPS